MGHLGNVRVSLYKNTVSHNLEVLQSDDYYAFGLRKNNLEVPMIINTLERQGVAAGIRAV